MFKQFIAATLLTVATAVGAVEVNGVEVPEKTELAGETLVLNGTGVRVNMFDIYVGALYPPEKASDAETIFAMKGPKRFSMHFLYSVTADQLISGFKEGFSDNLSDEEKKQFKDQIDAFNEALDAVSSGETVHMDFIPGTGTRVTIRDEVTGTIPGDEFYNAVLKVVIGEDVADEDLKEGLLGA
jgi:hypothetical protein